jgi:hypothetical protein
MSHLQHIKAGSVSPGTKGMSDRFFLDTDVFVYSQNPQIVNPFL